MSDEQRQMRVEIRTWLIEYFGCWEKAGKWLREPSRTFYGYSPMAYMQMGHVERVHAVIRYALRLKV